jgi:hypothetical protein
VIGEGVTPITWPRQAVQAVGNVIKRGLQFFKGHNSDNSTSNRRSLGKVLGHITKEIKGKLNQIVIGYFPDKQEAQNCDVCSIEADIILKQNGTSAIAEAIENITGIALGNSSTETPAFAGAVRLGSIQAFEKVDDPPSKTTHKEKKTEGDSMELTFEKVKQFLKDKMVWPNQVYDAEVLKKDHVFGKVYQEYEALKSKFTDLETKYNTTVTELTTERKEKAKDGAKAKLNTFYPEGITEVQKKFLEKEFNKNLPEDLSNDGLKIFVDKGLESYKEYASIFGGDRSQSQEPKVPPTKQPENLPEGVGVPEYSSDVDAIVDDVLNSE